MEKIDIVINFINDNIINGTWKKGDRIYGEIELAKRLKVSRNNVREALSILNKRNIIIKKVGSGSYISNDSFFKKKVNIIITSQSGMINDIAGNTYRSTINFVKEYVIELGYTPFVYIENTNAQLSDVINFDISEIAGVISVFGFENIFDKFMENEIPIINVLGWICGCFPSVVLDYMKFYNIIDKLLDKYSLKRVMFFSIEREKPNIYPDVAMHMYFENYLSNKGNLIRFPYTCDFKSTPKLFKEAMLGLDKIPDAIVFLDDTIYKAASTVFIELNDILSKTKIITHSSADIDYSDTLDICRVVFDLDDVSKKGVELMNKLINKEYVAKNNVSVEPFIDNEKCLKK